MRITVGELRKIIKEVARDSNARPLVREFFGFGKSPEEKDVAKALEKLQAGDLEDGLAILSKYKFDPSKAWKVRGKTGGAIKSVLELLSDSDQVEELKSQLGDDLVGGLWKFAKVASGEWTWPMNMVDDIKNAVDDNAQQKVQTRNKGLNDEERRAKAARNSADEWDMGQSSRDRTRAKEVEQSKQDDKDRLRKERQRREEEDRPARARP